MSRLPKARTDDVVAIAVAGEMVVQNPTGDEIARLDARTAAVWRLADGATSVADIAAALATEREAVWACLDRLSDWGLLEARVTPPAGARPLSRRGVLETAAGGAGWLGLASAAIAVPAFAADANSGEQASKRGAVRPDAAREAAVKTPAQADEQGQKRSARSVQAAREQQEKKAHPQAAEQHYKRSAEAATEGDRKRHELAAREERRKHADGVTQSAAEEALKRGKRPQ
jgi:hypothetical protein